MYGMLVTKKKTFEENSLSPAQMRGLIDLVEKGKLTSTLSIEAVARISSEGIDTSGKLLLKHMIDSSTKEPPEHLAAKLSLLALDAQGASHAEELQTFCLDAIRALPAEAQAARDGNRNVINKLVGYVMKQSRGRADANVIRNELNRILRES